MAKEGSLSSQWRLDMVRRIDIDWHKSLPEWSDYDLDATMADIQEEKIRRHAKPKKGFLVP
jgi:hypothetical protein